MVTRASTPAALVDALPRGPLLLILDFDGTLVEIAPTPDAIVVPDTLSSTIDALVARGHRVFIVTGRSAAFVVGRAHVEPGRVIGLHGLEWPGEPAPPRHPTLDVVKDALARALEGEGGAPAGFLVEDKGRSLAFHWRTVDASARPALFRAIDRVLAAHGDPALTVLEGHCVRELRPREASKARAIARLVREHPGRTPVFVGDDETDEEGFAALPPTGIAVRVARGPVATRAGLVVEDPGVVRAALGMLAER